MDHSISKGDVSLRIKLLLGVAAILASFSLDVFGSQSNGSLFVAGTGMSDITGPVYGVGMMGYADPLQFTHGIHTRLFSRAFLISNHREEIVYVVAEVCFVDQGIKLAVIDELSRIYPGRFADKNVVIMATHTHMAPGGFSLFPIYNFTVPGFYPESFDGIVGGIVRSIQMADKRKVPSRIWIEEGALTNASRNRSMPAYLTNPEAGLFEFAFDTDVVQLGFETVDESPKLFGILNLFAVHATAMSKRIKQISGDNKGIASYKIEREYGTDYEALNSTDPNFTHLPMVAGFGNMDEGDVSPDIFSPGDEVGREDLEYTDFEKADISSNRHYEIARNMINWEHKTYLEGPIQLRHAWLDLKGFKVRNASDETEKTLCNPSMGFSFMAGAEDGRSHVPVFREGVSLREYRKLQGNIMGVLDWYRGLVGQVTAEDEACHAPKPAFMSNDVAQLMWLPEVMPFHITRIGQLVLASVPAELTTTVGRRLRSVVRKEVESLGVNKVYLTGLSNSYSGYVATYNEYQKQNYEGASTIFGPNSEFAYYQIFSGLAASLHHTNVFDDIESPHDLNLDPIQPNILGFDQMRRSQDRTASRSIASITPGNPLGDSPGYQNHESVLKRFKSTRLNDLVAMNRVMKGTVTTEPDAKYARGQIVKVEFETPLPAISEAQHESYFEIEKIEGSDVTTVRRDSDPDTSIEWRHRLTCIACAGATVEWRTKDTVQTGTYRVHYRAKVKDSVGKIEVCEAKTRTFVIQ